MVHKGVAYPGQHRAIVDRQLWDQVAAIVDQRKRGSYERYSSNRFLLTGILYAPDGQRMLPTQSRKKNGRMYRYYVPYLEKRQRAGATAIEGMESLGHIPAAEIENHVLKMILDVLRDPRVVIGAFKVVEGFSESLKLDEPTFILAMREIEAVWSKLFPAEQNLIAQKLLDRVQLLPHGIEVTWNEEVISAFKNQYEEHPFVCEDLEHTRKKNKVPNVFIS